MSETATTTTHNATGDGELIARLGAQRKKWQSAASALVTERDAARMERDALKAEVEKLRVTADNSQAIKKVQELEGKLREIEYRKTWDRVAKAKGIREDALDAAYQLGGYKPAEGEIDENVIGEAIEAQKKAQTFLAASKADTTTTTEKSAAKAVTGSGQGGKSSGTPAFVLPPEGDGRWSDNVWLWNTRHERAAAYKEKQERGEV